jgi:hypothetical protein
LHGQGYETMLTQGYELALNASSYLTRWTLQTSTKLAHIIIIIKKSIIIIIISFMHYTDTWKLQRVVLTVPWEEYSRHNWNSEIPHSMPRSGKGSRVNIWCRLLQIMSPTKNESQYLSPCTEYTSPPM